MTFRIILLVFISLINLNIYAQVSPPPLFPGEVWTGMHSVAYNYQGSSSTRQIIRDPSNPANLFAIMTGMEEVTNGSDSRYIYGAYSTDYGLTWTHGEIGPPGSRISFVDIVNGKPYMACNTNDGSRLYSGSSFNSFDFFEVMGMPVPSQNIYSFPKFTAAYDDNIFISTMLYNLFNNIIQGSFFDGINWTSFEPFSISGSTYDVSGNGDSIIYVVGVDERIELNNPNFPLVYHKSTDGGVSFAEADTIFNYIVDGKDTLEVSSALDGGIQALTIDDELHVVFIANVDGPSLSGAGQFVPKIGIYHWSESKGVTKICGNDNIPNLEDSLFYRYDHNIPLTKCSIGKTPNGTLICAYNVFLQNDTQADSNGMVYNTGEVFYSYSYDNGENWSTPRNLTNTPGIDEQSPSLIRDNYVDSLHVYYFRDMFAGPSTSYTLTEPTYAIYNRSSAPVGIQTISQQIPGKFHLLQNYPNPFNPETNIAFDIPVSGFVKLSVFDITGKEVAALVKDQLLPGSYEYSWNASNYPSGVYFYKLEMNNFSDTRRMVLVK